VQILEPINFIEAAPKGLLAHSFTAPVIADT
jgi:hypothetical protein